jgi:hypothetical protein
MDELKFKLELLDTPKNEIDSFSRGHFSIESHGKVVSSIGKSPDQSIMIYFFVVQLLDGTRKIMKSDEESSYNFVGDDSSFQFIVRKIKNIISIEMMNGILMCKISKDCFISSLWNEVQTFLREYGSYINSDELVYGDLSESLKQFQEDFGLV